MKTMNNENDLILKCLVKFLQMLNLYVTLENGNGYSLWLFI